jgi:hypothetical protein
MSGRPVPDPGLESDTFCIRGRCANSITVMFILVMNKTDNVQCVRKVAVHLGVWVAISIWRIVAPWISLPTPFISAQLLSEHRSAESVCK